MIVQENLDFALPHIQFFDIFKQLFDILLPNIKTLTKTLIDTCFVTWNRSIQTLTKFYQILPFKGNFTNQTRRTLVIELNYRNVIHLFFLIKKKEEERFSKKFFIDIYFGFNYLIIGDKDLNL